jgi:hypothetical protein
LVHDAEKNKRKRSRRNPPKQVVRSHSNKNNKRAKLPTVLVYYCKYIYNE